MRSSRTLALATLATATLVSREVKAYRPFDQTDADVVEHRGVEIELGPVGLERSREELVLVAPALILNYGIFPRVELVVEGKNERALRSSVDERWGLRDVAVSVKGLVRRGSLQAADGISIALEPSVLLPGQDQAGVGGQVGLILSLLGPVGALHFNAVPGVSRAHEAAGSIGFIAEGPFEWRIRPVGEWLAYGEVGAGWLVSMLYGFIAPAGDALAFDGAVRAERAAGRTALEVRAGLTWTFGT
jgi:hypothetical protein